MYEASLQDNLRAAMAECGLSKILREGVYVGVSGPTYESAHEIKALRLLGCDAVGMSTTPEVVMAAHCGIQVLGFSLISNRCRDPEDAGPAPTHGEVLESTDFRKPDLMRMMPVLIGKVRAAAAFVVKMRRL